MRGRVFLILLLAVAGWNVLGWYMPITRPPGVLIGREPEQVLLSGPVTTFEKQGWTLKPLATYAIEARVLHTAGYYDWNAASALVPYDVAVGWGPMSDSAVLDRLTITQSMRWYHWQSWGGLPISHRDVETHSANMHLIADNDEVRHAIAWLRTGALVSLKGYLVEATHPGEAKPWRSSLRRDDTGDGACEVMLVRTIRVF